MILYVHTVRVPLLYLYLELNAHVSNSDLGADPKVS